MRRSIPTTLFLSLAVLLVALMLAPCGFAQGQANNKQTASSTPSRQLLSIRFLRIKSGMGTEWREFRINETLPMLQKAGVKDQRVSVITQFGEGGYIIVSPIESLAQFDSPGPAVRALGQEGAAAYGARAARFTESTHAIAIETRPELSSPPMPGYQSKLIVVTTTTVAPGRSDDYENFVKTTVLPAIKKAAPKGYLVSRVAYGGATNQYLSAVFVDSWADLQRYREIFSKEAAAARLDAKSAGIVTSRENAIYRFVPELSIMPPTQKAENR